MKINVFSFTRDRLDYTTICFDSLCQCKKYVKFDHYVVDNGSTDGTKQYIGKTINRYKGVIMNPVNIGLHKSAYLIAQIMEPCDLVIKVDNDCFFNDVTVIQQIVTIYDVCFKQNINYVLSPKVEGIVNQPKRGNTELIKIKKAEYTLGFVGQIGGICMAVPYNLFMKLNFNTKLPLAKGLDSSICGQSTNFGYKLAYIENITVNHYETTDGQNIKYPDYFKRKRIEENEI